MQAMTQADSNYTTKPSALIHDPHTNRTHESTTGDCGGLYSVSRRSLMNTLVALPIVAAMPVAMAPVPALASSDADPVFDLIEEHKEARRALREAEAAHALAEREMKADGTLFP